MDSESFETNDILSGLNASQYDAVTSTEGRIRVIAGAGSGKTRALSHRFAYLVNAIGIMPGNILCVTFTNKAANEMRLRIRKLTGDNDTGYISTFHGLCTMIIKEDGNTIHYPKNFLVLDNGSIDDMLKIIYEERGLTSKDMTFQQARDRIEILKTLERKEYYKDLVDLSLQTLKEKYQDATSVEDIIFYGYLYQEKKCFALDYNDLIILTLYMFDIDDNVRSKWQQRFEYIMIDEFQDIDALQYQLMRTLYDYHRNLFIVGDPDQTIYSWRGANVHFLLDFDKAFQDVKTIMMVENYRSTPQILNAANALIAKNTERIQKVLEPMRPSGSPVICHHDATSKGESQWISSHIHTLHDQGIPYGNIAVLYRAHYITRVIEEVFRAENVPYSLYSGTSFFERTEIKDVLSYLRMLVTKDDLSFTRVVNKPSRLIGTQRMKDLQLYADENQCSLYAALRAKIDEPKFAKTKAKEFITLIENLSDAYRNHSVSEVLADIIDKSGYEKMLRLEGAQERLDNLAELEQAVFEYETTCGEEASLEDYLDHIAMFTNNDMPQDNEKVKLMTIHAAKGLEFPYVFLCALNEDIFPSKKIKSLKAMEEERRLCFVALTRARDGLFLSEPEGQTIDGGYRYPSRFISDIGDDALEYAPKPPEELLRRRNVYISHKGSAFNHKRPQFSVGERVLHEICGQGVIVDVDKEKSVYKIQFDGFSTVRSISFKVLLKKIN